MRIPRPPARPWVAVAAVVAAAAILLTVIHQGNANANTGPPGTPDNTLAHLIVPDGEEPRIRVSWDAPDTPVSGYTIARTDGQTFSANGAATTFSDHTVEPGTTYAYSVAANSAEGASPASESASADVPDTPSAPGNLTGAIAEPESTDETATVNLTWLASTVPAPDQCDTAYPLTGYTIFRSDGDQETELGTADAGATSFTDTTATFSTSYTYRVTARSAIGASTASETSVSVFSRPVLPPTGLTASIADPFDDNISLSWNAPSEGADIVQYSVHRYLGPDPYEGTDTPITLFVPAPESSAVDTTAQAGVTYSYLVIAHSAFNVSLPSDTAVIEAPASASGLTATTADAAIDLVWNAPAAGTPGAYRVERQPLDGEWTNIADTTATSHSDDTAQPNNAYQYRVQHRNQHGGSTWTESEPVTLIAVPGQPDNLSATVDGNDNVLSWTAPDSPFIDGYRIQHYIGDIDWHSLAEGITDTGYRHVAAQADVTHHYAVQAYNAAGNGPWSEPASATRITPPLAPHNVSAQLDADDIIVTWERPDTVHVSGYTVRHQAGSADPVESDRLPEGQTSHRILDVTGDVTYRISVQAYNDAGDGAWSEDVGIMRRLAPSAPTNFAVAVGATDIVLSWEAPETGTADGYNVEYGEQDSEELATQQLTAAQTSYTHADSVEGVTYQYRVQAHNTTGASPWSETLTASRTLAPPAPTSPTVVVSGSAITISWTAPASGVVESYEVQYGFAGSGETDTASVDASMTSFTHPDAVGDTRYEYRVRSANSVGNSDWAGPVEAMWVVPPEPPTGVTAAIDGDDILVSWTRPDVTFIDEYQLHLRPQNTEQWTSVVVAADQTSHRQVGPTPGTTYEYRIRAVNAGGVSQWTDAVSAVWHQGAAPPAWLSFTPFGNRIFIQWASSVTQDVSGYQIRYRIDGGDWTEEDATRAFYLADWSADQNVHEYQMRALEGQQPGDWSAIHRATIATPQPVPSLTANREGANSARLHWEPPASGQPYRYIIQSKAKNQQNFNYLATASGYVTTRRVEVGYDKGYTFRVLAQNHVGVNGPHQEGVTAAATVPAQEHQGDHIPRNINARMLDNATVLLTWNAPQRTGHQVDSYRIYRKPVSDTSRLGDSYENHVLVAQTGNANTSYIDHTAEPGIAYEYGVAAYRSRFSDSLSPISHPAYARSWE